MDEALVRALLTRIRGFTHVIHERAQRELPPGMTVPHMMLMKALITAGPMTQRRLVDALGLSKGAVSQAVTHLEQEGLVTRRRDAADGRLQWVHLTPAADAQRDLIEARMTEAFAGVFDDWRDEDAHRLIELMDRMMAQARA